MKKALITGASGFAGSFLANHLVSQNGIEVWGSYIDENSVKNLDGLKDRINLIKLDLLDKKNSLEALKKISPDYIFHLAALTSPKESFDFPFETLQNNIRGQVNVLDSLRELKLTDTKILIVSSAEVYGLVKKDALPIDEETPFMPTSPYAVSKLTQDFLGLQYFLSYKLKVVRVRPFNHVGPRQTDRFVVGAFARKIVEIEKGKRDPVLPVGNLNTKRDFTDVRDMVRAYALILENGELGEVYNIGAGKSYQISEILNKLISLSSTKIEIKEDKSLLSPSDNPELICDNTKLKKVISWEPKIPIDETLRDTLDYWRNII